MFRSTLAILPLALFVGACSAQGTVELNVKSTSQAQTTAPTNPAPDPTVQEHLRATLTRVDVHIDDTIDNVENKVDADDDAGEWRTIFEGSREIDLFDSSAVTRTLGESQVPAGKVTQVRLYLNDDAVFVDRLGDHSIKCPSCAESGLKIVTGPNVEVDEDGILHLTLDFDADSSIVTNNSKMILKPVVHVIASYE